MNNVSRVTLQHGFVLHHRAYRDTSVLLELFTPEHGRVGAVARGVRKEKSRWAAFLQPFRPLLLSWSGRGELVTLTGVEEDGPVVSFPMAAAPCGFYLNEIMLRLLQRHDAHPQLFASYGEALRSLGDVQGEQATAQERILRTFEKRLLDELGYGLMLDHAADTGAALLPEQCYSYEVERGPVAYNERSVSVAVSGATLLALGRLDLTDAQCLREAKRLMRTVLAHYLGDKPLHSRELFQRSVRPAHEVKA
ncbi:MAG: DNA repair protein RecO [Gammaproteobacteria bacterium]|nr:DNA repair protein RecO [Gammaproteobacteria bacterium]